MCCFGQRSRRSWTCGRGWERSAGHHCGDAHVRERPEVESACALHRDMWRIGRRAVEVDDIRFVQAARGCLALPCGGWTATVGEEAVERRRIHKVQSRADDADGGAGDSDKGRRMEKSEGATVSDPATHTRSLPPHPQKLWPKAMRCDEILRSEEGDRDHHTRRKQTTRSSKKVHGNDGGIDETVENGSATEHAEASKRLKFLDDKRIVTWRQVSFPAVFSSYSIDRMAFPYQCLRK